jgi:hypothetical protein
VVAVVVAAARGGGGYRSLRKRSERNGLFLKLRQAVSKILGWLQDLPRKKRVESRMQTHICVGKKSEF